MSEREQLIAALQRLLRERAAFGRPKPSTWAETAAMLAAMGVAALEVDEGDAAGIDRLADAIRAIVADEVARAQSEHGALLRSVFEQALSGATARH